MDRQDWDISISLNTSKSGKPPTGRKTGMFPPIPDKNVDAPVVSVAALVYRIGEEVLKNL